MKKLICGLIFIFFLVSFPSVATSSHKFRTVKTHVFRSGAATFDGRSKDFQVNGSEDHSLAWNVNGACTITVSMIIPDGIGGEIVVAPSDLGNGQANPIVISGAGSGHVALFVPVAPSLRITVSGAVDGVIVFCDS